MSLLLVTELLGEANIIVTFFTIKKKKQASGIIRAEQTHTHQAEIKHGEIRLKQRFLK